MIDKFHIKMRTSHNIHVYTNLQVIIYFICMYKKSIRCGSNLIHYIRWIQDILCKKKTFD